MAVALVIALFWSQVALVDWYGHHWPRGCLPLVAPDMAALVLSISGLVAAVAALNRMG